jgi:hypothetical protein
VLINFEDQEVRKQSRTFFLCNNKNMVVLSLKLFVTFLVEGKGLSRSQTSTNHKLLTLYYSSSVVVVWYRVWKFVSPSRRFVCNSHTNSRAILNISATNQQQTNVFINNRPTLSSRALQGDSNAAKIIANGLVVTTTFRLL